jgi:hypothetical protein
MEERCLEDMEETSKEWEADVKGRQKKELNVGDRSLRETEEELKMGDRCLEHTEERAKDGRQMFGAYRRKS